MPILPTPDSCVNCGAGGGGGGSCSCDIFFQEILCDSGVDPVLPFLRVYRYTPTGTLVLSEDLELDGTTPYVVVGDVVVCSEPVSISGSVSVSGIVTTGDDHAEDSPHASGDVGSFALGVRNDAHAVMTSTDGDYSPLSVDPSGALNVADNGGSLTVDGTVTANQGTSPWIVSVTNFPASVEVSNDVGNPLPVSGTVLATQGTSPWVVGGTVAVSNFPASVEVSNDVGNPLPVSGTVSVSNFPASVEVSNDVGNPLPVSGTVTANQGTSPWVVSGSVTVASTVATADNHSEDDPHVSGDTGSFALAVRNDDLDDVTDANHDYSPISVDRRGVLQVGVDGIVEVRYAYPEDSPHTSEDYGAFVLAVRNEGATVLTDADLDYSPIAVDPRGYVIVTGDSDHPVFVNVVNGVIVGASDHAEDVPHASGDIGSFALGVRNDAHVVLTSTNGDYSPLSVDSTGALNVADNGGSLTVDGTVAVSNFPASVEVSNDVGNPLPVSGTVTANQGTSPWVVSGTVTVTDGSGPLTVDGTITANQGTSPWVVGGTIAVSNFPASVEVSNDVGNPLPVSGTVTANQGTSPWVVSGTVTASAAFQYAEDSGHTTGSTGAFVLAVRNDSLVTMTDTDMDYSPVAVNSQGAVWTQVTGTVQTYDVHVEDAPHASGDIGSFVLAVRNDAHATLTSTNLDYSPFSVDSSGALNVADNGGSITVDGTVAVSNFPASVEVSNDVGNPLPVSGTVTANQGTSPWVVSGTVTTDTELPAASALADADPNPTTSRIGSNALVFNGTTWDRTREPTADGMAVTGLQAAPSMVFNGTTWDRLYEPSSDGFPAAGSGLAASGGMVFNSTGSVWERVRRASADAMLGTGILAAGNVVWNGTTWDRTKEPTSDAMTVTGLQAAPGMVFGGTTWDRLRSGTTQGSVLVSAEKAEDTPHTTGQTGSFVLAVRNDAQVVLTDTDLDYSPIAVDSSGRIRTTISTSSSATGRDDTDGQAVVAISLLGVVGRNYIFNGTSWDRQRSSAGDAVAATGLAASANMVWNGASWDRLKEPTADSSAATGISSAGPMIWNGSTFDRWKGALGDNTALTGIPFVMGGALTAGGGFDKLREAHSDAMAVTGIQASGGMVYNGTTWDRVRNAGVTGMLGVGGAQAQDVAITGNPVLLGAYSSQAAPGATGADGRISRLWSTRQGTLRTYDSRRRRSGIYHASLGPTTVTAAADGATAGRWWLQNPVGSTIYLAVRKVFFSMTTGTGLLATSAPTFTVERFTFTGTASGASITPAKRETGDLTATGIIRTASTGMTITAGAAAHGFQVPAALATTSASVAAQVWPNGQDEDEWIILQGGEGIVIRQATAGTTADTRIANFDITWEEFNSTDYQIRD